MYNGWYVVSVLEVAVNIFIAARWRIISFKKRHLVERMTCLTLIIVSNSIPMWALLTGFIQLGEGVIGLTRAIVKINLLNNNSSTTAIRTIISAVLVLYLLYMLCKNLFASVLEL